MSEYGIHTLKQPATRLTMKQFFREMQQKLDDNHTSIFLKKYKMKKDLDDLEERQLMHEGAVLYIKKFMEEWEVYDKDTQNLRKRQIFEQNRVDVQKKQLKEVAKKKKKKKGKKRK